MPGKTFHIITFGCQMNVRDSQWLAAVLKKMDFTEAPLENADVIILNTCSVREKPEAKVKTATGRIEAITGKNPEILVCIIGCVAQQLGRQLFSFSSQVRLIGGTDGIANIPAAVEYLLDNPSEQLAFLEYTKDYRERQKDELEKPAVSAFVSIMQGCDNFCTYCIVPYTRGRQKSRLFKDILFECRQRIREGAKEITLLGQNVNAWGKDNGQQSFSWLLYKISELQGLKRLRFVTSHPKDIDSETIAAFGELENLSPSLHLPLQSGSDNILSAMSRKYSVNEYLNIVYRLKEKRPDIALTTDIIVGFPKETEEDFIQTLNVMNKCRFISCFAFCYSERPGTKACLLPDKIEKEVKLERLKKLLDYQETISQAWLGTRAGFKTDVLITGESAKKDGWQGRDPYGTVVNIIDSLSDDSIGEIVPVVITEAKKHSLMGKIDYS